MAAQLPVAASQMPGPVTNTIGAMQGRGRLTRALIAASPAGLAVKSPVVTLALAAESPALMPWQLMMAHGEDRYRILNVRSWPGIR